MKFNLINELIVISFLINIASSSKINVYQFKKLYKDHFPEKNVYNHNDTSSGSAYVNYKSPLIFNSRQDFNQKEYKIKQNDENVFKNPIIFTGDHDISSGSAYMNYKSPLMFNSRQDFNQEEYKIKQNDENFYKNPIIFTGDQPQSDYLPQKRINNEGNKFTIRNNENKKFENKSEVSEKFAEIRRQEKSCLNNCNNRGACVNGQCVCEMKYYGADCSKSKNSFKIDKCANNCNRNGRCNEETMECVCNDGFSGEFCENRDCEKPCFNGGKCVDGHCLCENGWTGPTCEISKYNYQVKYFNISFKRIAQTIVVREECVLMGNVFAKSLIMV